MATFLQSLRGLIPGQEIGESLVQAGGNIANLVTGGRKKFESGLAGNERIGGKVNVPALIGDYGSAGSVFIPVGRLGAGATRLVSPVLGRASNLVARTGAGAGAGYAVDVAANLEQGKRGASIFKPGISTVVGGAIPGAGVAARGVRTIARRGSGIATGVGIGVVDEASRAAKLGGEQAKAFRAALRGNVTPEEIRDEAVSALKEIARKRSEAYTRQLGTLKNSTKEFDTKPVIDTAKALLGEFDVIRTPQGGLDFSRSPGLAQYGEKIKGVLNLIDNWGIEAGDNTIVGLDKLKQRIRDARIGSQESRAFDSFIDRLANSAKGIIRNEPGYSRMLKDYETQSDLIKEITGNLSLGDKSLTDTGFRKLVSVLRTNNEFRKTLAEELNRETGGTLLPMVAGQQMSELAPRGLARAIGGIGAIGGLATGIGVVPIIKAALFTSPRLAGEVINAAGFVGKRAANVINAITNNSPKIPWEEIFPDQPVPENYNPSRSSSPEYEATSNSNAGIQNQAQADSNNQGMNSDQSMTGTLPPSEPNINSGEGTTPMTREEFRRRLRSGEPVSRGNPRTGQTAILSTRVTSTIPPQLRPVAQSIVQQESGGKYSAVGIPTNHGRALGRYQIIPKFHFSKIGLNPNSPTDRAKFLKSPELQDTLFAKLFNELTRTYKGNVRKIVAAYYGGGGAAAIVGTKAGNKPQKGGMPSINQYVASVLSRA